MNSFYNSLTSLFLIFYSLGVQLVLSYSWHSSTELWDLEYTGTSFIAEVDEWSCPLLINSSIKYSICSGSYIMGGYNIMGGSGTSGYSAYYGNYWTRYYGGIGIPAHNQVNVIYTVYAIDSWDGTTSDDHYSTSVDDTMITCWHFSSFAGYGSALCGTSGYKDYTVRAYLTFPHTALNMTLKFTNYLNQVSTDESLGIRDIQIDFVNATNPATSICGTSTMTPLSTWACSCSSTNQYMYPPNSGTCYDCDSSCVTCSGGTTTDCTSCETGEYLSSDGECLQCSSNCATCSGSSTTCTTCNSDWFMVESACYSSCDSPLEQETVGSVTYCETPCPGEYIMWDGSCSPTCNYTTTYSTFTFISTTVNTFLECSYSCSSDEYLYFNGSCLSTCPSPLTDLSYIDEGLCDYSCSSSDYLYWNGSCRSTCPSPLSEEAQGSRNFCWYTCQPDEYLYWNGSCLSTCPSPLSGETQGTYLERNFCWYTCQPDEYLYWNGSCFDTCPSPLSGETQGTYLERNFCWYTCQSNQYLYWDGSCQTSCDFPLVSSVEGSPERQFCWYLCNTTEYLYWNGTCSSSCDSPLIQSTSNNRKYCNNPCKTDDFLKWYIYEDGSCSSSCSYPYQSRTEDGYQYCDGSDGGFFYDTFLMAPTEAGATSLVCLVKIMHYIRYLDIEMPTRLEGLVQSQPRNILTLQYGSTMSSGGFGEYSLIPVFQKPGNHSSFFVNYFQTFTSILIGLFAGFCLQLLERLSMKRGYKTWQAIFEVLRVIFKWNFCLILLAFNVDFIILYSFLEFGTADRSLGSGLPNFSLATDIIMILIGLVFLIGLICLIRKIYKISTRVVPEPPTNTVSTQESYLIVTGKWQGFRILFTGFKETPKIARYFYLIYTIRIGLPIVLACGLYHFPMINTTLQVNISIAILIFILKVRLIKKKINLIQLILFEALALMMNFCIFILTAIDTYNYDAQASRVKLGDAVIIGNSLTNLLSLIFLALKLSLELKILIPLLPKMTKHEKYASFAKLVLIWIQQGAMGFEEIFDELTPTGLTRTPHTDQIATVNTETSLKNSSRIKKREAAFPTLSTEGDNTFDDYARTTRRLKDMTPGTARIFNDNASQIGLRDNFSQIGGVRASALTEDPSFIGIQRDTSPTLRKGNKKISSTSEGANSNSKRNTPQRNFEPSFSQNNENTPGNNIKFRSNIKQEPYYNYNSATNQGMNNISIHPHSATSVYSLDISDNSPQMRQPGFGNRRLDRTGTNLLASGTSKIYEEEDDQLDRKAARWNFSSNPAVSQNLERDYSFPIEEDIHSKMQRKATWHYWKAKGREKEPEKSVFEYSDITITKK